VNLVWFQKKAGTSLPEFPNLFTDSSQRSRYVSGLKNKKASPEDFLRITLYKTALHTLLETQIPIYYRDNRSQLILVKMI
jgi:hypothetical protein